MNAPLSYWNKHVDMFHDFADEVVDDKLERLPRHSTSSKP